jgi:hypothetical protein
MESDSSNWEPELLESHLVGHDPEYQEYEIKPPENAKKPGPKKMPVMWSRVISISEDGDEDIGTHNIEFELQELLSMPRPPPPRLGNEWSPIFHPVTFSKDHPDLSMDAYRLGEKRLRILGVEVSKIRAWIRKEALHQAKAEAKDLDQDVMDVSRLARRV